MSPVISSGANVVGGIIDTISTAVTNRKNREFAEKENAILRAREDNAVQRRQQDLKKAGINPILAGQDPAQAQLGHGLTMVAPTVGPSLSNLADNIVSHRMAQETERHNKAVEEREEKSLQNTIGFTSKQMEEIDATVEKLGADTKKTMKQIEQIAKDIDFTNLEMITEKLRQEMLKAETEHEFKKIEETVSKTRKNNQEIHKLAEETLSIMNKIHLDTANKKYIEQLTMNAQTENDIKELEKVLKTLEIPKTAVNGFLDVARKMLTMGLW